MTMTGAILLLICLILIGLSIRSFQNGLRRAQTERVLSRLAEGQPQLTEEANQWSGVERMFLRAGLGKPTDSLGLWLAIWALGVALGLLVAGWLGLLVMLVLPPALLRLYIAWRYQRRIKRMIEQLPQLLDHTVRSLKAGRTLADSVLGGIEITEDPLQQAMGRIQRNVQLGVSLPESTHDFAEFYERDEFRLFALGLKINHRYGGNASELLENLIKMIREREQAARQLRALTGETRVTAYVLGALPISMIGYFLVVNPAYLMTMWNDGTGRTLLFVALGMQLLGCFTLWRMLRSV
jgi:tight adherence protein B